jgi:hypothetical protein
MREIRFPMLDALSANGPAPGIEDQMMLYGRFVGSWTGRVFVHGADGGTREASCEVHFGWVLEGRAIQDVWIAPARKDRRDPGRLPEDNLFGTTLRVYDPENGLWNITWINPTTRSFNRMTGREVGEEMVQEYRAEDGAKCQWIFTDIRADSFHWIGRESRDEGETWKVSTEFLLRRTEEDPTK